VCNIIYHWLADRPFPDNCCQSSSRRITRILFSEYVGILTQWRRQLWGTEARAPPRLPTIHFSLLWSKPDSTIQILCSLRDRLVQLSTTHSSFNQYCISHKTTSHRAAAAPGPEVHNECPMT